MLFNSVPFIYGFLPITFGGFFILGVRSRRLAGIWLALASVFFYGWWNANFVALLLASVLFNYALGYLIGLEVKRLRNIAKWLLGAAVASNLLLLGYFKYLNFFAGALGAVLGTSFPFGEILLPLGISFFTFTQIAFLVDTYQGKAKAYDFIHYLLFVTYFPHLIAGPILHHKQVMPQFALAETYRFNWANISAGMTMFAIGLVKKVLLADTFGQIADPVFKFVQSGEPIAITVAWAGALAYTLQIYFDFSGYSDMAVGLSLLFNVKLPFNFDSPYKATNIIDFWRRWHMTLSAFLLQYVYIPLGGNRYGKSRRYINLMITMLLGGLWHGAGWTFILWGALHGLYLVINHGMRAARERLGWSLERLGVAGAVASGALTFVAVVLGWVVFRADSIHSAQFMLWNMFGGHDGPVRTGIGAFEYGNKAVLALIVLGLAIVWLMPNSQQFMRCEDVVNKKGGAPSGTARLVWKPAVRWSWIPIAFGFAIALLRISPRHDSPFLYFQF